MSDFVLIDDQAEALKIKLHNKNARPPEDRFINAVNAMSTGAVIFVPGATVNTVTQYRHWMTIKIHRKLRTKTGERDGVHGLYMWAGEER